jgi:concentrative nucleoside transporter, CNT family
MDRNLQAAPEKSAEPPSPGTPFLPTPWWWRAAIGAGVAGLTLFVYLAEEVIGPHVQAGIGIVCFIGVCAALSANLRAVNWRTVGVGLLLQLLLALFVLKLALPGPTRLELFGWVVLDVPKGEVYRPGYALFQTVGDAIARFLEFSDKGASFVFGKLAEPEAMEKVFGKGNGFVFAFRALPPIIFVSSFFTVLYFFGVLQFIVRVLARLMMRLMGTSGAETLSAVANVFMGQTEAPLIVKPYVVRMTQSELLALMVGGMATISGGIMAVYISLGADRVAILATSVMAAPCGLYLSKLLLPEMEQPETRGEVKVSEEQVHRNAIDAAAGGASDGLSLALNVGAMLIAFLAFLAFFDYVLGLIPGEHSLLFLFTVPDPGLAFWNLLGTFLLVSCGVHFLTTLARRFSPSVLRFRWGFRVVSFLVVLVLLDLTLRVLPADLSLQKVFAWVFSPVALLMGVEGSDVPKVADLLGLKLTANEFVAYLKLTNTDPALGAGLAKGTRAFILSTFALTGFANFASVGIQLGGIGGMAPSRRPDLARLGMRALLAGFLATLINASLAGMLL